MAEQKPTTQKGSQAKRKSAPATNTTKQAQDRISEKVKPFRRKQGKITQGRNGTIHIN